jgi:D-glycero-D-manno-heptose 1,7-bisphosphate phosphatase
MNSALFLDRDGVINVDYGYVYKNKDFHFIDSIFELVRHANHLGYLVVVVTNQAGIARGFYSEEDFHTLTLWVNKQFESRGAKIDKTYFCPFHKNGIISKYKKDSYLRKPKPGMIKNACIELSIDPKKSILVGDKITDIEAGINAGIAKCVYFNENECNIASKSTNNLNLIKKELTQIKKL